LVINIYSSDSLHYITPCKPKLWLCLNYTLSACLFVPKYSHSRIFKTPCKTNRLTLAFLDFLPLD